MFLNNYCFYFQNIWIQRQSWRIVGPVEQIFDSKLCIILNFSTLDFFIRKIKERNFKNISVVLYPTYFYTHPGLEKLKGKNAEWTVLHQRNVFDFRRDFKIWHGGFITKGFLATKNTYLKLRERVKKKLCILSSYIRP